MQVQGMYMYVCIYAYRTVRLPKLSHFFVGLVTGKPVRGCPNERHVLRVARTEDAYYEH